MYKIYFNNVEICVSKPMEGEFTSKSIVKWYKRGNTIKFLKEIAEKSSEISNAYLFAEEVELAFQELLSNLKVVVAGGGIVFNEFKELLLIKRKGKWDLPKGKLDKNEEIKLAAVREVKEECGMKEVWLLNFFDNTHHIFTHNGIQCLKLTHWFLMFAQSNQKLKPQEEEDITEVKWVRLSDLEFYRKNTYKSICFIFDRLLSQQQHLEGILKPHLLL